MSRNLVLISLSLLLTEDSLCVRPIGWHVSRPPPLPCSRMTGLGVGVSLDSVSEAALSPPTPEPQLPGPPRLQRASRMQ